MSPAENGSAAAAAGVTITGKSFVIPARSPEKPICPLSTFDLPYITFYYNQKLLLYKFAGEEEEEGFRGVVARLKEGLAAALSKFYPLAGRIVRDDSGDGTLAVDCGGGGGAEVVEAAVEWVAVDELVEGDELAAEMMGELVPYGGVMNLEGLRRPLLALQAIFTATAAGLLQSGPPEFGAGLLRTAIGSHDASAVAARLEEYEAKPKLFYFSDAGANTVAVGSSPRFPVYDVDFGFGRPARVRSGPNNKFDGMMYLYPGRGGGRSVDVELTLDPAAMENLVADEEFLKVGD